MDVLNEFSLVCQASSWLLIKKTEFAVVWREMSVPFSISVWEQGPAEYKLRARAKTLICKAQVLIWQHHSLLWCYSYQPGLSLWTQEPFFPGCAGPLVTSCLLIGSDRDEQSAALGSRGHPCQSVAGQRNLQPCSQGADIHPDKLRALSWFQWPATGLR